jgi:polysaccharide export outer membrane protein
MGILGVLFLLFCSGCESTNTTASLPAQPAPAPGILATGDVIKLTNPGNPEYSQIQKIRPDGKISLPMIGEVDAAGKRIGALQDELATLYKGKLKTPEIVVTLDSSTVPVYITGAVGRPGKIVLDRPMSVLEGIMEAGGFSPIANQKQVVLVRIEKGQHRSYVLDLSAALRGETSNVIYLRPYDVIYVKENLF